MEETMEIREAEGGGMRPAAQMTLVGTENQVAWAEQIRSTVHTEFDRVASALEARGGAQAERQRSDTFAMISILEEKRAEVMANQDAGYFIRDWQELRDQVRLMIIKDPRFKAITATRTAASS